VDAEEQNSRSGGLISPRTGAGQTHWPKWKMSGMYTAWQRWTLRLGAYMQIVFLHVTYTLKFLKGEWNLALRGSYASDDSPRTKFKREGTRNQVLGFRSQTKNGKCLSSFDG
jgi:hypothetical protein